MALYRDSFRPGHKPEGKNLLTRLLLSKGFCPQAVFRLGRNSRVTRLAYLVMKRNRVDP
jgi:hypothetical protein